MFTRQLAANFIKQSYFLKIVFDFTAEKKFNRPHLSGTARNTKAEAIKLKTELKPR